MVVPCMATRKTQTTLRYAHLYNDPPRAGPGRIGKGLAESRTDDRYGQGDSATQGRAVTNRELDGIVTPSPGSGRQMFRAMLQSTAPCVLPRCRRQGG